MNQDNTTPEYREEMQRLSAELQANVDRIFREHGIKERLSTAELAAQQYRNLFNMFCGVILSQQGMKRACETIQECIIAEREHWKQNRDKLVRIADGWRDGRLT